MYKLRRTDNSGEFFVTYHKSMVSALFFLLSCTPIHSFTILDSNDKEVLSSNEEYEEYEQDSETEENASDNEAEVLSAPTAPVATTKATSRPEFIKVYTDTIIRLSAITAMDIGRDEEGYATYQIWLGNKFVTTTEYRWKELSDLLLAPSV